MVSLNENRGPDQQNQGEIGAFKTSLLAAHGLGEIENY